jgi:hypothetical protein
MRYVLAPARVSDRVSYRKDRISIIARIAHDEEFEGRRPAGPPI